MPEEFENDENSIWEERPPVEGEKTPVKPTPKGATAAKTSRSSLTDRLQSAVGSRAKEGGLVDRTQQRIQSSKELVQQGRRVANMASNAASTASNVLSAIGSALMNPVTYVIIAVLVVVVFLWSTWLVIGHNENADGCLNQGGGSGSGMTVNLPANADHKAIVNAVGSWLMTTPFGLTNNKPMTKEQAAAVIGNMTQESGVDPTSTQNSWTSKTSDNNFMLGVGDGGGKAIGLAQWDGPRRTALVKEAQTEGKQWSDINVQLTYLKKEIDSGYQMDELKASGFNADGKSVEDYTNAWELGFEQANLAEANMPNRLKGAQDFMTNFSGANGVETGGSCLGGLGNPGQGAAAAVALAVSMAYEDRAQALTGPDDPTGVKTAKPEYLAGKAKAEQVGGKDDLGLYNSCDRFVATVVKLSYDKDIPWGNTEDQYNYLNTSPKWKRYDKKSEAQPGDVWVTVQNGHVVMYIGQHNGVDSIASASSGERVGSIGSANYLNDNLVDTDNRQYAGFRYIGGGSGNAGATLPSTSPSAKS